LSGGWRWRNRQFQLLFKAKAFLQWAPISFKNWNNFFAVEDTTVIHSRHAALLVG
jgi:hypothetical protein